MVEEVELLAARVVSRLVTLRAAGALQRACDFAEATPGEVGETARLLWDWSRTLGDAQALIREVFEPALREPGRRHQRRTQLVSGRPRGATSWPRTVQQSLQRPPSGTPRFVCTVGERSVIAPENLLLIASLEDALIRGAQVSARLEHSALLAADDRELYRRHRQAARRALATPWVQHCREALRTLDRGDAGFERTLEAEVRERLRGRPCAAPAWARRLLELRRAPLRVPDLASLRALEGEPLWQILAGLEVLALLRRRAPLRQQDDGFADHHGLRFGPLAGTPTWVVAGSGRPSMALLRPRARGWQEVRREALYWSWTAALDDAEIDRWLILHRAEDGPGFFRRERRGIELLYWRLDVAQGPSDLLTERIDDWLRPAPGLRVAG
ncbi:MAG: hypothetical protein KC431_17090 [Myxococcales bacterium]|nr:hypothetical protein [Myxococcales bacterium]